MDFKEATDGIPAKVLARAFGVEPQTVRHYRMSPGHSGHRSPPDGWRNVVIGVLMDRRESDADRIDSLRADQAD